MSLLVELEKALSSGDRELAQEIAGLIHGAEGMMEVFDAMYEELDDARKLLVEAFEMVAGRNARLVIPPGRVEGDPRGLHGSILAVAMEASGEVQRKLSAAAMHINRGLTRVDGPEDWAIDDDDRDEEGEIANILDTLNELLSAKRNMDDPESGRFIQYAIDEINQGLNRVYGNRNWPYLMLSHRVTFESAVSMLAALLYEVPDLMRVYVMSAQLHMEEAARRRRR